MNSRRGFLASLAGAAAIALDPERALWLPGAKLISVPAPRLVLEPGEIFTLEVRYLLAFWTADPVTGMAAQFSGGPGRGVPWARRALPGASS